MASRPRRSAGGAQRRDRAEPGDRDGERRRRRRGRRGGRRNRHDASATATQRHGMNDRERARAPQHEFRARATNSLQPAAAEPELKERCRRSRSPRRRSAADAEPPVSAEHAAPAAAAEPEPPRRRSTVRERGADYGGNDDAPPPAPTAPCNPALRSRSSPKSTRPRAPTGRAAPAGGRAVSPAADDIQAGAP